MTKSVEELLHEAGDEYQTWYDAITNMELKGN
jgi:hypothetical protein